MKRFAALSVLTLVLAAAPCQAQFLKKLEQQFMGGQGQGQGQGQGMPGQPTMVGNANLPPGQYVMTNSQTGQAFYITIQNGQMYMMQGTQQGMAPGGGMGGGGGLGGLMGGGGGGGGGMGGLGGLMGGGGGGQMGGGMGGQMGGMGGMQQQGGGGGALGGLGGFLKNELGGGGGGGQQQGQMPGQ